MVSWKVVSCQFVEQSLDIEIGHFIEEFDLYLAPLHVPNVQNTLASNDNEWVIAMFHFCQKQIDFLRNKFAFSWIYSFSNIDYTGSRKHHKSPHNNHNELSFYKFNWMSPLETSTIPQSCQDCWNVCYAIKSLGMSETCIARERREREGRRENKIRGTLT